MDTENASLQELRHIKQMMERSARFSTLSGFSGIAAGLCSLLGAWLAYNYMRSLSEDSYSRTFVTDKSVMHILLIAIGTFAAAAVSAYLFIYMRCRRLKIPVFSLSARRVVYNMTIPIVIGALFILRLITQGDFEMLAPASLLFYGLALINASKYTLNEVRQLGFAELAIGLINLLFLGYGVIFWAVGFGIMHIIWGALIWWRYERKEFQNVVVEE